ncbi:hypothetical protein KAR91_09060 [Candidatus Pacearchaeota archaeon]|nr:hypothetical protein [Candidatus Pacearchaeota archaeon]
MTEGCRRNGKGSLYGGEEKHHIVETPEYDITCPESGGQSENAYKSHCITRLTSLKPPMVCKRCAVGAEVLNAANIVVKSKFHRCTKCERVCEADYNMCPICREKETAAKKKRTPKNVRICTRCSNPAASQTHKYCATCKELASAEANERERVRIHKRIENEKAKLARLS